MRDTRHGEHNILIYPDIPTLNQVITKQYKDALENRNELALFVTYYQSMSAVRKMLREGGIHVTKFEKEGSLVIFDAVKGYQSSEGVMAVMSLINLLFERVKKLNKSGMFGMADMGSFFLFNKTQELMSYELSLPSVWDNMKLRSFCLYHERDFRNLDKQEQQALIEHHYKYIKPY